MPTEKRGEMARHRGIGGVGKPKLREPQARPRHRTRIGGDHWKEAVDDRLRHFVACQLRPKRPAQKRRTSRSERDRRHRQGRIAEQFLFGLSACVDEARLLPAVDRLALSLELLPNHVRQGEIHVVAAEQDMVAHCDSNEIEGPVLFDRSDRGEVGCPAADVDDENDVTRAHLLAPSIAQCHGPGVKRGLWFFEQRGTFDPRRQRGLDGQLARSRIERRRDGDDDLLLGECVVTAAEACIEGLGEMFEVPPRRLDGRDLFDVVGSPQGQKARPPVHRRMREPALGAGDDARRRVDPARSRVGADGESALRIPGERLHPVALVGKVEKRWKEHALFQLPRSHELRNRERFGSSRRSRLFVFDRRDRKRRVRGPEIDAHGEPRVRRCHPSSTSAGARIEASCSPTIRGSSSLLARHPR